jgi:glutamate/tyrosine decarboxylase-like PLP-dependent enzyme
VHHFDERTEAMARAVFEYTDERLHLDPVPLDRGVSPAELAARAPTVINEHGTDARAVLELFGAVLAPAVISSDSPRFLAFIPAAPTKASLLFDMVVSSSSLSGISWLEAAGAIHAENQVLRFLADVAGLPAGAGGCFVSGGSAANLSALVTAREEAKRRRGAAAPVRWRFAVSEQTHSSVANTARILDVDLLVVPTGADDRLTGASLADVLARDEQPDSVAAVIATGGTTNAGIVDDLAGVGTVARERGIWFHADCAYGGAALLAESARHRFDGVDLADSFVVDPHKWLYAPFDCAALLYREPELARRAHTQHASYLDVIHTGAHDAIEWNPTDYAYHLTRRARGLPLWFSLAVNGWGAYRDAIERVLATTRAAAARIDAHPDLELLREPELSIVLYRRTGWSADDYDRWSRELLDAQIAFVTPSKWRGETVARLAFLHPETTIDIVDEILATMA